jgi:hypothetical protein
VLGKGPRTALDTLPTDQRYEFRAVKKFLLQRWSTAGARSSSQALFRRAILTVPAEWETFLDEIVLDRIRGWPEERVLGWRGEAHRDAVTTKFLSANIPPLMRSSLMNAQVTRPWQEMEFEDFRKQAREAAKMSDMTIAGNFSNQAMEPRIGNYDGTRGNGQQTMQNNTNQQNFPFPTNATYRQNPPRYAPAQPFNGGQTMFPPRRDVRFQDEPRGYQNGFAQNRDNNGGLPRGAQGIQGVQGNCNTCGIYGNYSRDCRIPPDKIRKFQEAERTGIAVIECESIMALEAEQQGCYYCKMVGHIARNCTTNPKRAVIQQDLQHEVKAQLQPMRDQMELLNQQLQRLLQQNNTADNPAQQRAMAQRSDDIMAIKGEIVRLGCSMKRMEAQANSQIEAGGEPQPSEN